MDTKLLAEKIGGKFWEKHGKTRIYLDRGFNTQKMRTSTYIEIEDNELNIKCFIDCESQPYNWIKSQQNKIISEVEKELEMVYEQERKDN